MYISYLTLKQGVNKVHKVQIKREQIAYKMSARGKHAAINV
jgi:hypothetical protein